MTRPQGYRAPFRAARIAPGIYDVHVAGRLFEIEQVPDRTWQLVEVRDTSRAYYNHFGSQRSALRAIAKEIGL